MTIFRIQTLAPNARRRSCRTTRFFDTFGDFVSCARRGHVQAAALEFRLGLKLSVIWLASIAVSLAHAQTSFQLEGAAVWQSLNEVAIPGDTGTRFDLVKFGRGPKPGLRVYVAHKFDERHELRALIAPLAFELTGEFDSAVSFQGASFAARTPTTAGYRFNSYRLTYAYHMDPLGDLRWAVGFTGKIRDAQIRLQQGTTEAAKDNVGFVPLLHLRAQYPISEGLGLRFDMDGLAAPQGRAFDVLLAIDAQITDELSGYIGYRTVEGGADNKTVYNFAWLHFAVLGATLSF
jgi:hypothetical protein